MKTKSLEERYSKKLTGEQVNSLMLLKMFQHKLPDAKDTISKDGICQIIQKRIDVYELPVKITDQAFIYLTMLCEGNPGRAVVSLIDILDSEVEESTIDSLVDLYPWGHYSEEGLCKVIDEHKARKHKWSHIY